MTTKPTEPAVDATQRAMQAFMDGRPGVAIALPLKDSLTQSAALVQAVAQRVPLVWDGQSQDRSMRYRLVPVPDPDGSVRRVVAFAEDVTEQMDDKNTLRSAQEQFRFVSSQSKDVVWQIDGKMRLTYINDADYHLRGCPREAVIGQSLVDLFTEEGRSIIAQVLARRRESAARGEKNTILKFEAPQVCQNGRLLWVEVHAAPFHNQSGQTVGYIGITRPVGEHGRMESLMEETQREVLRQQQEIAQLRLSLQEQALRDPLTGLHNRRYLDETFPRELSRARREGYPLSLILVGVDHFKTINESHGHAGGDAVLQALSLILNLGARDSDIFCRYGNKEFLVVCPLMGLDDAQQRAETWRMALSESAVEHGGYTIPVTLSAGIAAFPDNGADVATLLQRLHQAFYRAQQGGRNCVVRSPVQTGD